ncbi:MAG: hypothetical protein QM744_19725 [Mesorhizobium sp.]
MNSSKSGTPTPIEDAPKPVKPKPDEIQKPNEEKPAEKPVEQKAEKPAKKKKKKVMPTSKSLSVD